VKVNILVAEFNSKFPPKLDLKEAETLTSYVKQLLAELKVFPFFRELKIKLKKREFRTH
jgi:hypothetical protein